MTMAYGSFSESDLLALIEEELDPKTAEALRQRLAQEPEVQALVERICADRAQLRSAGEPPLPEDLLSEIEPMLARPMLMPETDWRRRNRRGRRAAPALVAAALLAVGIFAGIWAVGGRVLRVPAPAQAPAPAAAVEAARTQPAQPAAKAPQQPVVVADASTGSRAPAPPVLAPRAETRAGLVPAGFVLVVAGGEAGAVEASIEAALAGIGPRTALVRNFTYDEADRLQGELIAEGSGARRRHDSSAPTAGTSPPPPRVEIPARQRRDSGRPAAGSPPSGESAAPRSEILHGPRDLAPSYEQQLEHSQWGAAYTISIPAGRLNDLLALLNVEQGRRTELRLPRGAAAEDAPDPLTWVRDYAEIQQTVARLRAADQDALILLPVVVE